MRLVLPILLLTTSAALAQPAPEKPFLYDGVMPPRQGFTAPTPVTVLPALGQEKTFTPTPRDSQARVKDDRNLPLCMKSLESSLPAGCPQQEAPRPNIELRRVMPDLQPPEPPKPAPRGFG